MSKNFKRHKNPRIGRHSKSVQQRSIPGLKAKQETQKASTRTMSANDYADMAKMFSNPITAPLITAPMSDTLLPPSPVEAPNTLPSMRCITSSYGSEICLPEPMTGAHQPPCSLHDNPHPGLGPCGFPGTGIPGFHPQYPLGSRWKMTKTGYVADVMKQCLQSPLSMY